MGNTWSKLLVAAAISTAVTSENTQEFDVELFRKNWMQYLNEQNAKRRRDKYLMRTNPSYNSRNLLSDTNNNLISNATIKEARNLNEALYVLPSSIGVESKKQSDISGRLYKIFKDITIPEDSSDEKIRVFKTDMIDFEQPKMIDFEILAIFAKIAWTKGSQKGVVNQYIVAKDRADSFANSVESPEDKLKFAEFWFGAAQIFYASDKYPLTMECVGKVEHYADLLIQTGVEILVQKAEQVKYRAQIETAKALREGGKFKDAMKLTDSVIDKSRGKDHLLWPLAYALNNKAVIYGKMTPPQFDKCPKIVDESEAIRKEIGDGQGVSSSQGNRAKTLVGQKQFLEALKFYEKSRDWRVANADTWGIAGSDFAFGRTYLKMALAGYHPIFYGMAVRRYIPGLKGFQQNAPKLGECETSEYFTILLTNIGKTQDAQTIASINLFFRSITTPAKLEPDTFDSLFKLGWLTKKDKQKIDADTEVNGPEIIQRLTDDYKWKGNEIGAVRTLESLLQKYKNQGLDTKSSINYLYELDIHIKSRDNNLKTVQSISDNHYIIGKTYLEMRSKGYGEIFISLGAREFIKALQLTRTAPNTFDSDLVATIRNTLKTHSITSNGKIMQILKSFTNRGVIN